MRAVAIPTDGSGVAAIQDGARAGRDAGPQEAINSASLEWYRLQFHPPYLALILVASSFLLVLATFVASPTLHYSAYVGLYLFLLSVAVLLPLAFKANTAGGLLPFPAGPFVGLNFLYFVLGTLVAIGYPDTDFPTISLETLHTAILILALSFAFFSAGIIMSGSPVQTWFPHVRDRVTV